MYKKRRLRIPPNMKTHDEFVLDVAIKFGENQYELLSEYNGSNYDIKIKHIACGHTWQTKADRFIRPKNKKQIPCPICNKSNRAEEFEEELRKSTNNSFAVIGTYLDGSTPIKLKHNIENCGYEFSAKPNVFINQTDERCPICSSKEKAFSFMKQVYEEKGYDFTVICEFNGSEVKYSLRHNKCGTIMNTNVNKFNKKGVRCTNQRCSSSANKYNFKDLVFEKYGSEFKVISGYVDSATKIRIKHNVEHCMKIYDRIPKHFLYGKGLCPYCRKNSKGEEIIVNILKSKDIKFIREYVFDDCKENNVLRFDFAILDKFNNLICLLEYDGGQHFKPVDFANKGEEWAIENHKTIKERDKIKNQYCKDNNHRLIRIPYWHSKSMKLIIDRIVANDDIELNENFIVA